MLLVALTLRGAVAAVSPVLPQLRGDLGMSATAAGLLTTLPVLCYALAAPPAALLGRRLGAGRAVLASLLVLAAATVARVAGPAWVLLAGTLVVGMAMTVGNVLVPAVLKRDFPAHAHGVTGLYTAALVGGAALTAALTAPLADAVGGWRAALALWAALAVVAMVAWHVGVVRHEDGGGGLPDAGGHGRAVARSPVAWAVAVLLAGQSFLYFSVTAWLPTMLVQRTGVSLHTAGVAMSVFQVLGVLGTLVVPLVVGRRPGQSALGAAVALGWAVTVVGLLLAPGAWAVWAVTGGLAQGAGLALTMTLVVLRSATSDVARDVSAMVQLVGYAVGATGAVVVGLLLEVTGGWTAPLLVLLAAAGVTAVGGIAGGRPTLVQPAEPPRRNGTGAGPRRHNGHPGRRPTAWLRTEVVAVDWWAWLLVVLVVVVVAVVAVLAIQARRRRGGVIASLGTRKRGPKGGTP